MNRKLLFGIALFFAVVGIALVGGENQAVAGFGCRGCHGGLFGGGRACHGGLFARHCRGASNCCGVTDCGGGCAGDCGGGCYGNRRCHGGLFARLHARRCACRGANNCWGANNCGGVPTNCCGPVSTCHGEPAGCHGGGEVEVHEDADAPMEDAPEVPEAPESVGEST